MFDFQEGSTTCVGQSLLLKVSRDTPSSTFGGRAVPSALIGHIQTSIPRNPRADLD